MAESGAPQILGRPPHIQHLPQTQTLLVGPDVLKLHHLVMVPTDGGCGRGSVNLPGAAISSTDGRAVTAGARAIVTTTAMAEN